MISLQRMIPTFLLLAGAAVGISFAPVAEATPVNVNFTVNVTSGPLSGTVENGSFSYDSSSIVPNSPIFGTTLFTTLHFTFNGATHNATNTNTRWLAFDSVGNLNSFMFGTNCSVASCSLTYGQNQWWLSSGVGGFSYSAPGFNSAGSGDVTFAIAAGTVPVPEPGTLVLFCFGLLLIGGFVGMRCHVA